MNETCGKSPAAFFVGGVNPYATYEIDIASITPANKTQTEIGFGLGKLGLRDRVQVIIKSSTTEQGVYVRVYIDGAVEQEIW